MKEYIYIYIYTEYTSVYIYIYIFIIKDNNKKGRKEKKPHFIFCKLRYKNRLI